MSTSRGTIAEVGCYFQKKTKNPLGFLVSSTRTVSKTHDLDSYYGVVMPCHYQCSQLASLLRCLHQQLRQARMTLARAKGGWRELNHLSKLKPLALQYFYRGIAHDRSPYQSDLRFGKDSVLFCCSFHIRSKDPSIPKLLLIYWTVVILSQLAFKGHGKSTIFSVKEGFIIRGDPPPFEGPS